MILHINIRHKLRNYYNALDDAIRYVKQNTVCAKQINKAIRNARTRLIYTC